MNEQSINMYNAAEVFMLRAPLLSIKTYKNLFTKSLSCEQIEKVILDMSKNNVINELIQVSSLSLNKALRDIKHKDDKSKVLKSLLKYIIRSSTRTTPYGLCAGICIGNFEKKTYIKIKDKKYHVKRVRPDMEWLYAVIKDIENSDAILDELKVIRNDLVFCNGDRLNIDYISNFGQTFNNTDNITGSIRYTNQVKFVMEMTNKPIKYGKLVDIIKSKNQHVSVDKIKEFLNQLLKNEYLLTQLRTPLINTNPFNYLLAQLKDIKSATAEYVKLDQIRNDINKYNMCSIGQGKNLYSNIVKNMKDLHRCKNYLQLDLKLGTEKVALSKNIGHDIEKVVEMLVKVSVPNDNYNHLRRYINDFIEKYGTDREIPVIELLDDDIGLGSPAGYTKPISNKYVEFTRKNEERQNLKNFLTNKAIKAVINGKKEINITEKDINKLKFKNIMEFHQDEIPKSLELNVFVTSESCQAVDSGEYEICIGPNIGSDKVGRTFGRFRDMLCKTSNDKLKDINKFQESMINEDIIFAEISELHQHGRLSNVAINYSDEDYEIPISTNYNGKNKKIKISDLYIGIENALEEKFYIKSKSLNKKVIVTSNNMLNIQYCSNILRFLVEISEMNAYIRDFTYPLIFSEINELNYTPRIKYGKVTLSLATWKLSSDILNMKNKTTTKDEFYRMINCWRKQWNVPRLVYQKDGDNRLLLNMENKIHLELLYDLLKKNSKEKIIITEIEDTLEKIWVSGENEKYICEFVVPVLLNNKFYHKFLKQENTKSVLKVMETKSDYKSNGRDLSEFDSKRCFVLGDEWLYLKIYNNSKRVDEFISNHLLDFCNNLKQEGYIDKFFFIRYADPESHIRLRLKLSNTIMEFVPKLNEWLRVLIKKGIINKVLLDTYFREIERYGGKELINLAEDIFYVDSVFVANLIKLRKKGELKLNLEIIAVANIINLMDYLNIDYKTQKNIFEFYFDKDMYRDVFRKNKAILEKIGNSCNEWKHIKDIECGEKIYNFFQVRKSALQIFARKMNELDDKKQLCNSKINILLSIIHMHCNRLFSSNDVERKVMSLVRHTLHSIEYIRKINQGE